ncbi:MAG: TlpA disulfide reductase family protein [Pseudoxanthomonas sp.]
MTPSNRLVLGVALAAAIAGAAASVYWSNTSRPGESPTHPPAPALQIGQPMPALVLHDLAGNAVDLRTRFQGRPLLINAWASWCAPCVEEMPALQALAQSQGERGVQVLGLALDTPDAVRAFLERVPVNYPIVLETPSANDASVRLGNSRGVLPYSVLIGADGRILKQKLGPFRADELSEWIER